MSRCCLSGRDCTRAGDHITAFLRNIITIYLTHQSASIHDNLPRSPLYGTRYTTFVQPPTAKNRDDHILPTLISILRDNTKVEVKLRRRCVAALGELVFYITAQEEETHTTTGTADSRWALPHGAITVLTKCLKDDSDEAVRHYAAKVSKSPLYCVLYCACYVSFAASLLCRLSEQSYSCQIITHCQDHYHGSCIWLFS